MEGGDLVTESLSGQRRLGQLPTPSLDGVEAGADQIGFLGVGGEGEFVAHGPEVELDAVV